VNSSTPKIRMYTTQWCPDCVRVKGFLTQRQISFEEINIEKTPGAADFVIRANAGRRRVPTLEIDGRIFHCSPYDPDKLSRELGIAAAK
jgi:mycoredoxin